MATSCFGFRKFFRDLIIDKFAQSDLAMVQFTQRQVFLVFLICFSLFSFIFNWIFFRLSNDGWKQQTSICNSQNETLACSHFRAVTVTLQNQLTKWKKTTRNKAVKQIKLPCVYPEPLLTRFDESYRWLTLWKVFWNPQKLLATASFIIPSTGVTLLFSFTSLPDLDARSKPLF